MQWRERLRHRYGWLEWDGVHERDGDVRLSRSGVTADGDKRAATCFRAFPCHRERLPRQLLGRGPSISGYGLTCGGPTSRLRRSSRGKRVGNVGLAVEGGIRSFLRTGGVFFRFHGPGGALVNAGARFLRSDVRLRF